MSQRLSRTVLVRATTTRGTPARYAAGAGGCAFNSEGTSRRVGSEEPVLLRYRTNDDVVPADEDVGGHARAASMAQLLARNAAIRQDARETRRRAELMRRDNALRRTRMKAGVDRP
jgi:hypothetical protein